MIYYHVKIYLKDGRKIEANYAAIGNRTITIEKLCEDTSTGHVYIKYLIEDIKKIRFVKGRYQDGK